MAFSPVNRSRLHATLGCFISGLLWWRTGHLALAVVWSVLLLLAGVAWFAPRRYAPVQHAIDSFNRLVLLGVTWTILAIVFFALFTPLRWWHALVGRDPLQLRRAPAGATFLRALPPFSATRFDRQY